MKVIEVSGAIILDKNNRILLIHRNTNELKQWELPGGKLEKEESPEEAVIRELKEELNIKVNVEKYIGFKHFEDNGIMLKYYWYQCGIQEGIPKLMEEKFDDLQYFSKEELNNNNELSANMKVLNSNISINEKKNTIYLIN